MQMMDIFRKDLPEENTISDAAVTRTKVKAKAKAITREQLEIIMPSFKPTQNAGIDYDSMYRLFTHKYAQKLNARQLDVIQKLTTIYKNGIVD